jgi:hypothetical protein
MSDLSSSSGPAEKTNPTATSPSPRGLRLGSPLALPDQTTIAYFGTVSFNFSVTYRRVFAARIS